MERNLFKCYIKQFKGCCCICKLHIPDHFQCTTHPLLRKSIEKSVKPFCICGLQKGWICLAPELEFAHSNWPEHGMCEMFTKRDRED